MWKYVLRGSAHVLSNVMSRNGFDWYGNYRGKPFTGDRDVARELAEQKRRDEATLAEFASRHNRVPADGATKQAPKDIGPLRINNPTNLGPLTRFESVDLTHKFRTSENVHSSAADTVETIFDDGQARPQSRAIDYTRPASGSGAGTQSNPPIHATRGGTGGMLNNKVPKFVDIATYARWIGSNSPTRGMAINTWYTSPVVGATGSVIKAGYAGPMTFMTTGYYTNDFFITSVATAPASAKDLPPGLYIVAFNFCVSSSANTVYEWKVYEEVDPNTPLGPNGAATVHAAGNQTLTAGAWHQLSGTFLWKFPSSQSNNGVVLGFGVRSTAATNLTLDGAKSNISITKVADQ